MRIIYFSFLTLFLFSCNNQEEAFHFGPGPGDEEAFHFGPGPGDEEADENIFNW